MVTVGKCCICLRLSTGAIILGSFGAFSSLLLVIVIGGFLLNYDNFISQSYGKGAEGDQDSKRLAVFLETYKNGEKEVLNRSAGSNDDFDSCHDNFGDLHRSPMYQLRQLDFSRVRNHQRKDLKAQSK